MLHSGVFRGAGGNNPSSTTAMPGEVKNAKPYAVMEFEGLLATALSNQSLETLKEFPEGIHGAQQPHHSNPPALPLTPPLEMLAQWKRARGMEIRPSPHHVPKSSSDGGLLRRAYLDVTQSQFSNEFSSDHLASHHQRYELDRLDRSNHPLRQDKSVAHPHGGFIHANIRPPTCTSFRTSSPWSSVAASRLISPRSLQHVPISNFPPDLLPRHPHGMHNKPQSEPHPNLSPRTHGHRTRDLPSTEASHIVAKGRAEALHLPMGVNGNGGGVLSHIPPDHSANAAFPKSFRAAADDPSSSTNSLSFNVTGSSSSSSSLFSSPPSQHNCSGIKNNNADGNSAGPVSYFAHSPFADTGSGNTSTTLSDGPIPIVNLLQKPGPNLIKPIACKPSHDGSPAATRSPSGNIPHRGSAEADGKNMGPQFPRAHPLQPSLSSRLHSVKQGSSTDPHSPDDAGSNNLSGGSGAFGKLADSSFPNETRLTSFVGPPGPATDQFDAHTNQPMPSSLLKSQQPDSSSIYKNITPVGAHSHQGQQHQSPGDPNTSYSSFTGEFPHSDTVCAPQTLHSNNTSAPSSHQPYQSQHHQQQRVAAVAGETNVLQTPSPSDSGVGEHEAILREKDAEINTLREVMDRNERAIFQVYEERRHVWLNDTRKLQDEYERKLKIQSRKSYKTEQVLSLQVYKLQQEQKSLQEDKVKVTQELDALKQRLEEEQTEVTSLRKQLGLTSSSPKTTTPSASSDLGDISVEKTDSNAMQISPGSTGNNSSPSGGEHQADQMVSNEGSPQTFQKEVVLKNKELIQLRTKLACFEADLNKANKELSEKVREISNCNDKIKSLQEELHKAKNPPQQTETGSQTHAVASQVVTNENLQRPSLLGKQEKTIDELQEETLSLRAHIEEMKTKQEEERKQWLDEKNKVVRYQKQLQLNYVQMQRKNTTLETEVQQLTLELENRDMKITALNGEESVC